MLYTDEGYPFFPQPPETMIGYAIQQDQSVLVLYDFFNIIDTLLKSGLSTMEAAEYFWIDNNEQCKLDIGLYNGE